MNTMQKVCRLCLGLIENDNFTKIEANTMIMLGTRLRIDVTLSKDPVMCAQCTEELQKFFEFKSTFTQIEIQHYNFGHKPQPKHAYSNKKGSEFCKFCVQLFEPECLTQLTGTVENQGLVDALLRTYIPELAGNFKEELFCCEACLKLIRMNYEFIKKCRNVDETIRKYAPRRYNGKLNLHAIYEIETKKRNTATKMEIKTESSGSNERNDIVDMKRTEKELVDSSYIATDVPALKTDCAIKVEEVHIKSEPDDCESSEERSSPLLTRSSSDLNATCECGFCTSETVPTAHSVTSTLYKCIICDFESKYEKCVKKHAIRIHKSSLDVRIYKCATCAFETKHEAVLARHVLKHRPPKPPKHTLFKCDSCSFETFNKRSIESHKRNRHNALYMPYKCNDCPYATRRKDDIQRHVKLHRRTRKVQPKIFKCDLCPYKSRLKHNLKKHSLVHTDVPMYKCEVCAYETKYRFHLKTHSLIHKETGDITMFQCHKCGFAATRKVYLRRHLKNHSSGKRVRPRKGLRSSRKVWKYDNGVK